MAFFKFRKSAGDAPAPEPPVQSVQSVRQRAKYRLVGATVLILVGVVVLPLLFDRQPRPIAVDTPIDIPDKNKVLPLVIPSPPSSGATAEKALVDAPAVPASLQTGGVAKPPVAAPVAQKNEAPAAAAPEPAVKPSVAAAPAAKPAKVNRAQALLDGKDAASVATESKAASASGQRFVVQVGAFADSTHAREVRLRVERAGMKTYTQVADTKDGKRIRVRVGPFASRSEADKAATRIKKLNLPAALLTL